MRLDKIEIKNFKGFDHHVETFDENFTVLVGENGAGKTSFLEAVSVGLGPWINGIGSRSDIKRSQIRLVLDSKNSAGQFLEELPLEVGINGRVKRKAMRWKVTCRDPDPKGSLPFSSDGANELFILGSDTRDSQALGENWPLLASYSADRGNSKAPTANWNQIMSSKPVRVDGYENWNSPEKLVEGFVNWLGRQETISYQENIESSLLRIVKDAISTSILRASNIFFSAKVGEPVVQWGDGTSVAFSLLSHGQRSVVSLVGDIARRCATLNPHLEADALTETNGVVLIDELDLHLHPRWQRTIVDDLKRTFPKIQFIATTHSPFIIQSLEPGELRVLGGDPPTIEYSNRGIEEIVRYIQGVDTPHTSARYAEQKEAAKKYFKLLREGRTVEDPELNLAKERLDRMTAHFSDNPALDAYLDVKSEGSVPLVNED